MFNHLLILAIHLKPPMKRYLALVITCMLIYSCGASNKKSNEEKTTEDEWIVLFDGNNLDQWEMFGEEPIVGQWIIENGLLKCRSNPDIQPKEQRSLMSKAEFGNFELELEFVITENANSGIMYHVVESPAYKNDYETGPEYQILDDNENPDRANKNRLAANYDMHAPADTKPFNGVGEWNNVKLIYNKGHVEHWLNGTKVLEFEEGSPEWTAIRDASKWSQVPDYAVAKSGHLTLQDHGGEVWYRNIRIKSL